MIAAGGVSTFVNAGTTVKFAVANAVYAQVSANTLALGNSSAFTVAFIAQPIINHTAAASTSAGSGTVGATFTISAQAGQAATGASNNGGNGGPLNLTAGVGGTSGSATAGKGGVVAIIGGRTVTQVSKSATYSVDTGSTTADYVIFMTGNAFTITLPAPTAGRELVFIDSAGNANTQNKTIAPNAAETINGASSYVITLARASITLISDGTNWFVKSEYNGTII